MRKSKGEPATGFTLYMDAVLAASQPGHPEEREAALAIAGRVWRHFDTLTTAMGHAYLDEMTDRGADWKDILLRVYRGIGDDRRGEPDGRG